jgi:two-component system response regulator RegA
MTQGTEFSSHDAASSSDDMSLLIVDDEQNLRNQLAKAMERRGFIVAVAESVSEGKQLALANRPKYAVVDLRLGDGSGLEVVEVLREARGDVCVIVLTASC